MPQYNANNAEILVFTYKEGLLSPVAHDLKLRVDDFQLEIAPEGDTWRVSLDVNPRSVRVVCAVKDGRDAPGTLSKWDLKKTDKNTAHDVLEVKRFPALRFVSSEVLAQDDGAVTIRGPLTLHGMERPIQAVARREGADWTTEVRLWQPDFGIKPFTALLGSMKIKPEVTVRVRVPAS